MRKLLLPLLIGCSLSAGLAQADTFSDNIKAAMKAETRSEKDKDRDRNRRPVQTLEFFGIQEDMKVLELIPGGGWYTSLLAPALKDKGQLYLGVAGGIKETLLKEKAFSKVKTVSNDSKWERNKEEKRYDLSNIDFGLKNIDAVLTFRNYHNFTLATRTTVNKEALKALKPGGIYGIVDHTRRHMQKNNDENGRRVDPLLVIKEVEAAGFEFVDYSNLHYKADDELRYEVGRKSVRGNTDRFTLLFKKPMK
ncbi:MAG: class I SAM-dependent methyltransferase [Colwellia sp.]|nr:class I SAM-dependent methyltransferase [Colwellia sp.]